MVDPQQVIDESRPMLEWFLHAVGIYQHGQPIADLRLRDQFSDWLDAQDIREEDTSYIVVRVAAFICEYLIEGHSAVRFLEDNRILLRQPIEPGQGLYRDFDPYAVAADMVREKQNLKEYLQLLCERVSPE